MMLRKFPVIGLVAMAMLATASVYAQQQDPPITQAMSYKEARAKLAERFKAADTNHDGKLTREEAEAGFPQVYKHFDQIDIRKRGYVTQRQIGAYWAAKSKNQAQKEFPVWN